MSKRTKLLSILLCAVFLLTALPTAYVSADEPIDWEYTVISGNSVELTKYLGSSTVVEIPASFVDGENTYVPVRLGANLFAAGAEGTGGTVTEVTIPESVLYTRNNIFLNNTNLTKIVINGSGFDMGTQFARGTSGLREVVINGYVKSVGQAAFLNSGVTSLVFPEGLETVYDYAFKSYSLTDITIPASITAATGDQILYGSAESDMRRITIRVPDTVTEAFVRTNFKWLKANATPGSVFYGPMVVGDGYESNPGLWPTNAHELALNGETVGHNAVVRYTGSAPKAVVPTYNWQGIAIDHIWGGTNQWPETVMIPETVVAFNGMFKNNTNILHLVVNCDIAQDSVFQAMSNLETAVVNGTMSANYAFYGCPNLVTAELSDITSNVQNAFHTNANLETLILNGVVPDTSTTLVHATSTVPNLKTVVIGENGNVTGTNGRIMQLNSVAAQIETVELRGTVYKQNAFYACTGIKNVRIYKTSSLVCTQAFRSCTGIENVWIEEGTTIGSSSADCGSYFQGCTGITDVTISKNATIYGYATFAGCTSLRNVTLNEGVYVPATLLYGLSTVKNIFVNGACNVNLGLTGGITHYYLTDWFEGLTLSNVGAAIVRSIFVNPGDVLTDNGGDMLEITREGLIFAGYTTYPIEGQTYAGKEIDYQYVIDNSLPLTYTKSARPKFIRGIGGDVNGDGNVNIIDLIHFKKQQADAVYPLFFADSLADLNEDGYLTASDLVLLRQILLGNKNTLNESLSAQYALVDAEDAEELVTTVGTVMAYDSDNAYTHVPFIEYLNGKFYSFWEVGTRDEDADGQYLMWSYSEDGELWEDPMILSAAQYSEIPGGKTVHYAGGFITLDGELYADYAVVKYDADNTAVSAEYYRAKLAADGVLFEDAEQMETNNTSYMNAFYRDGRYYKTAGAGSRVSTDGITWYQRNLTNAQVAVATAAGASICEPAIYVTGDATYHLLMRGEDGYIWHCLSLDCGLTWSDPVRTALTNENAKFCVGQIKSGSKAGYYYIIGNFENTGDQDRNPLYIALSIDGYDFGELYVIESEYYDQQQSGIGKGGAYAYPSAVEYVNEFDETCFAVAYSCGKEEIRVSTFTFD